MRPQGPCTTDHMERDLNIVVHVQHYENMETRPPPNNLRKLCFNFINIWNAGTEMSIMKLILLNVKWGSTVHGFLQIRNIHYLRIRNIYFPSADYCNTKRNKFWIGKLVITFSFNSFSWLTNIGFVSLSSSTCCFCSAHQPLPYSMFCYTKIQTVVVTARLNNMFHRAVTSSSRVVSLGCKIISTSKIIKYFSG